MRSTWRTISAVALAGAAAAVMSAPTAAADPASFLDELAINSAAPPGMTPDQVVGAGYATCDRLRGGGSPLDEMTAVEQAYQFGQGTLFVSAATTNLCPDFAG